jgi:asparagine synthase (glutamine-hydrolysing)
LSHRFKTRSDTEVILRGYLQWGADVAERLNGMFSFAIWDTRTEELLLVRDRMGVKPLFYYPVEDGVLFGSEPKAILAHPSRAARGRHGRIARSARRCEKPSADNVCGNA